MGIRTIAIGETVEYRGVVLRVEKMKNGPCYGCYFRINHSFSCYGTEKEVGYCTRVKRSDGHNVIFKKVK